jgi:hypothetical protein
LSCRNALLPTKSIDSAECIGSFDSMSWLLADAAYLGASVRPSLGTDQVCIQV